MWVVPTWSEPISGVSIGRPIGSAGLHTVTVTAVEATCGTTVTSAVAVPVSQAVTCQQVAEVQGMGYGFCWNDPYACPSGTDPIGFAQACGATNLCCGSILPPTCSTAGGTCVDGQLAACGQGSTTVAVASGCAVCCVAAPGDGTCSPVVEDCGTSLADCPCPGGGPDPQATYCAPRPGGRGQCTQPPLPVCSVEPLILYCCGNGICEQGEAGSVCPQDCGGPPPPPYVIGDGTCTPVYESCGNSPSDCPCGNPAMPYCSSQPAPGTCVRCLSNAQCNAGQVCNGNQCISAPPFCGDHICNNGEDINSCVGDCMGDGVCAPYLESCGNSPSDCPCPGNLVCSANPYPGTCVDPPPNGPVCGNWSCEAGESCNSCENDCGTCPPDPGPSCGAAGGDYCSQSGSCPDGFTDLGGTYDCAPCCLSATTAATSQPSECGVTMSCPEHRSTASAALAPSSESQTVGGPEPADPAPSVVSDLVAGKAPEPRSQEPPPPARQPREYAAVTRKRFVAELEEVAA